MPLYSMATAPDDLDESADALAETNSDNLNPLSPTGSLASKGSDEKQFNAPFLINAEMPVELNKNTNWFSYPGVWSMYFLIVVLAWLLTQATLGCSSAAALVVVNITHFLVTFYCFHWVKGSPFSAEDQGKYEKLTWWEQIDSGRQLTRNRKFLTMMPVALFLLASMASSHMEHASSLLFLNTAMVFVLVIAKLPVLHKVRILGING